MSYRAFQARIGVNIDGAARVIVVTSPDTIEPGQGLVMTTFAAQPSIVPSAEPARAGGHFIFENVDWDYYQKTLRALEETRVRVTYDRGRMELMSPLPWHEFGKKVAARLLEFYAFEIDLPITGYGSVTCQHEELDKGVEPDECYYVQTPPPPPTKTPLDLSKAPRPDVAIEVDVTSSSIPRMPIYAAMGVPEIWRLTSDGVTPMLRNAEGRYEPSQSSPAFPRLDISQFNRFLRIALEQDQHAALKSFRDWIRSTHQP